LLQMASVIGKDVPLALLQAIAELPEADLHRALALADALGMRPLEAHCRRGLGTLYARTGPREQARAELSTTIDLYRAMVMTFWLPQAEAELARVR
jgi:Flp pilus assembly protein TadD